MSRPARAVTGKLKVFKLMGGRRLLARRQQNEMLQRIYGTAWATKDEQDAYCTCWKRLSAAITARSAANSTCSISGRGPGLIFWHPKGWALWQQVEQYMRGVYRDNGWHQEEGAADSRHLAVEEDGPLGQLP